MMPFSTEPDEELVLRAQNGSEAHFDALVDRYTPNVYRLALGITGDHLESEEVVQETFLRAYKHLGRFSASKAAFKTWLLTIARNQSINIFKFLKRKTARVVADWDPDDHNPGPGSTFARQAADPEAILCSKQECARMERALAQLPERQRTALLLKCEEQMSYDEIASIMGTSVSSVESLIFRARKRLLEMTDV
jgi:RNA polymerase sigma factor (sigma-70 family)